MSRVRVLVLRAAGINCDEETMHCWRLAGARPTLVHINEWTQTPSMINDFNLITIPGGFSYGDDIAAGAILAQRLSQEFLELFQQFVRDGGGVLGICNGFQVLVKMGLLPGGKHRDALTVTYNDSARFEARWVRLSVDTNRCPFLEAGTFLEMPVEHAEGKVVTKDDSVVDQLSAEGLVALRYVNDGGERVSYPANPNGSVDSIAGLCDETGRVFGLMPHPDRAFAHWHHPQWTRRSPENVPDGLSVFHNAVGHWSK